MQSKKLSILGLVLLFFTMGTIQAQEGKSEGTDKVLMNDGSVKEGRIQSNDENGIMLVTIHEMDTVSALLQKKDITKITYADGTVEQIGFGELSEDAITWEEKLAMYKNKVAVLPFVYEDNFNKNVTGDNMSLQTQMDCIKDIQAVNSVLEIQNMDSINATLVEHNIDWKNIRDYLPSEVADILEVEFIVYGTVRVTPIGKENPEEDKFGTENQTLETPQGRREGTSISPKKFETIVDLNIYDILGETVYSNAHESFWQTADAYNMNLNFLVEESPFNMK